MSDDVSQSGYSDTDSTSELRQILKDDIEGLLRDYLRDNLGNWHVKPTPDRIEEYLQFHTPGYTREVFAQLFDKYATAQKQRWFEETKAKLDDLKWGENGNGGQESPMAWMQGAHDQAIDAAIAALDGVIGEEQV